MGVLVRTLLKSRRDHAKDMAASMAYFSFFSLFPLLLGVIAGASYFIDEAEIQRRLTELLVNTLPGSLNFVSENVGALFRLRRSAGLIGIAGLLWSAGKMFGALSRGVNGALGLKWKRLAVFSPLRRFTMAVVMSVLLFLTLSVSTILEIVVQLDLGFLGNRLKRVLTFADGYVASVVFTFLVLVLLYRLVPFEKPAWREVLPGALFAAVVFELGKTVFSIYIDTVANFEAVYGSVSSIIMLLLWLYFAARVILFGAELIAVRRESAVRASDDDGDGE